MYQLIIDTKENQSYSGKAEACTYNFSVSLPDQLGAKWTAQQAIDAHRQELQREGHKLLELKVWEDRSPTWQTNYIVKVVATASPGIPWLFLLKAVLLLLALLAAVIIIVKIEAIIKYIGDKLPEDWDWMIIVAIIAVIGVTAYALIPRRRLSPAKEG